MPSSQPIFWITRPSADSETTLASIAALGGKAIASPVMQIEILGAPDDVSCAHVIITSKYACHAAQNVARSATVWAVGEKTGAKMKAMGFAAVRVFAKAQYLLQAFAREVKTPAQILYLRGETVRMDITAILRAQHYQAREHIAYRTLAETTLATPLHDALAQPLQLYVMLYSAQAASFAAALLTRQQRAAVHCNCISDVVREAALAEGFAHTHVSKTPDGAGMLMLAQAQITAKLAAN